MPRKGLMKLEERTVSGVRVREKHRVRRVLAQPVGVRDRDHFVPDTVDHKRRLMDALQIVVIDMS